MSRIRSFASTAASGRAAFYMPVLILGAVYVLSGTLVRMAVGLERWQGSILLLTMLKAVLRALLIPGPAVLWALLTAIVLLCCAQLIAWHRSHSVLWPFHLIESREHAAIRSLAAPVGSAVAVLLFMSVLSLGLTQWKVSIPHLVPFWSDELLMRLDRAFHFGRHPWQLLGADRGTTTFISFVDFVYHPLWLWVIWFAAPVAIAVLAPPQLLRRYLMTFVLSVVVLGTVAAVVLSSAGPIFYEAVVGAAGPYAALIEHLQRVHDTAPLTAWIGREYLWESYRTGTYHLGTGISAMPSMHVAAAALTTMVAFRWNPVAGFVGVLFTAAVLYGSVYLAWHYAIDGYLSLVAVPALWWLSGILLRRWDAFAARDPLLGHSSDGGSAGR